MRFSIECPAIQMVEIKIRINPTERQAYIPKLILETFGPRVSILPNTRAAILYTTDTDPKVVERSVQLILQHLKLLIKSKKQTATRS